MGAHDDRGWRNWLVLVVLLLPIGAIGGGWADFSGVFPLYPCQDGWLGCVSEDGEVRSPQVQWDKSGRPLPSDMRVDWDGNPTQTFSPFVGLSPYSGEEEEVAEPPPEPQEREEVARVTNDEPFDAEEPSDAEEPDEVERPRDNDSYDRTARDTVKNDPVTVKNDTKDDGRSSGRDNVKAKQDDRSNSQPTREEKVVEAVVVNTKVEKKVEKKVDNTPEPSANCDDLKGMQMASMSGMFSKGQIVCLNKRLSRSGKQTEKVAISKLLMNDVWAKGDKSKRMQLANSHLQDIDKSDPDLVYKYVVQLSKKGSSRARGVVRWAGVALENKTRWSGSTYKKRVNGLLYLKTRALSQLYEKAAGKAVSEGTPSATSQEESAKNSYKTAAREWYEYTKQANLDGNKALQACIAAAGFEAYCTGR